MVIRNYLSLTVIVILFWVDPSDRTKKLCHTSLLICFVKLPLLSLVQVLQWRELQRWGWRRWTSPKIGQLCTLDTCSEKSSGISRNLFGIASYLMGYRKISWDLERSHGILRDLIKSHGISWGLITMLTSLIRLILLTILILFCGTVETIWIHLLAPSGALIAITTYYWSTTTPPPLFQITPVLNTGLSLSEPL